MLVMQRARPDMDKVTVTPEIINKSRLPAFSINDNDTKDEDF